MPISERQIRSVTWVLRFEHKEFRTYTTDLALGFALLHHNGLIEYRIKGKGTTDSLSQAVRWWNDEEKRQTFGSGHAPPGSPQAIREKKSKVKRVVLR